MNGPRLRVGIVGAGYIAAVHSAGYRTLPLASGGAIPPVALVGVADVDVARAEALAGTWGWDRATSDWRELTRADDIDLIDVCVPNALHPEVAIDALAHGKHVVCEKPLAADVAGAEAMVSASEASDLLAQVCFYYRLWPTMAWARRLIDEGRIGEVQHIRCWMLQDYASDPSLPMGWRTSRAVAGAGALGDIGSHAFDIARYLAGEATSVCAITRTHVDRGTAGDVDDRAAALVRFESGAAGVLEAGWAVKGHKCDLGFDVTGERGALSFSWERSNEIVVATDEGLGGSERVLVGPAMPNAAGFAGVPGQGLGYRDSFAIGLARIAEAIHHGSPEVTPSFTDGLRVCDFVAAAAASARSQRWEDVAARGGPPAP